MAGPSAADKFCLNVFYFLISAFLTVHGLEEFLGTCGLNIDLMLTQSAHSGILTMPLPETMSRFQDPARPINCDIIIAFPSGTNLLIELYYLDIMPRSGDMKTCSTGLEIFDQIGRKYYGSRICMEGWLWEERHREKQHEKHLVQNSPLTIRLASSGPYRGEGFKLHFNQLRPNWPCFIQEFKCHQIQRCVHDDLMCDGWDDCGDYSDERIEAGCDLLSASEICGIIMGVIILTGAFVEVALFVTTYKRYSQDYGLKSESKTPVMNEIKDPVFGIGQRINSQDSLPNKNFKSAAPFKRRQEPESYTGVTLDPEKADRYNKKSLDDVSERSSHSNSRRKRAHSRGTDETITMSDGHEHRNTSQTSLNYKRAESLSGNDNPALENDDGQRGHSKTRERVSDRDRYSPKREGRYGRDHEHSSDSDSYDDRDKYRGHRWRSSHERRKEFEYKRSNRYSDEDSDYDRYREHRRRRSYDTYSDDSEYERERRRNRERHSSGRYNDRDGFREDKDKQRNHRDSFHRDGRKPYSDGENERPIEQRRNGGRRYSPNSDRDYFTPSKNRQSKSWEKVQQQEMYRESPPELLPPPPPYSEEDIQSFDERNEKLPPLERYDSSMDHQKRIQTPPNKNIDPIEELNQKRAVQKLGDNDWKRNTDDCRERYSRNRCTSQKEYQGSPPPKYKEFRSKPVYKEESV